MNKKAAMNGIGIGAIIMAFVGIIVAISLINGGISRYVADATQWQWYNTTSGDAAVTIANGGEISLTGKYVRSLVLLNTTNATAIVIPSANYTIINNRLVNGVEVARLNFSHDITTWYGTTCNISYEYQPTGYITDSGGRTIAGLIVLFACLAVAAIALIPVLKQRLQDYV